ncbi:MAG: hypothetical protein AB7S36_19590, partial [Planctomycetota bacterium]
SRLFYVFNTEAEELALLATVNAARNWPRAGCTTTTYATPLVHPTDGRHAVPANNGGVNTEAMRTAALLPEGVPEPSS